MARAAPAARAPMTANAMPYSARSCPASPATSFLSNSNMCASSARVTGGKAISPSLPYKSKKECVPASDCGVDDGLSCRPERVDIFGDGNGRARGQRADDGQRDPVFREILPGILRDQFLE